MHQWKGCAGSSRSKLTSPVLAVRFVLESLAPLSVHGTSLMVHAHMMIQGTCFKVTNVAALHQTSAHQHTPTTQEETQNMPLGGGKRHMGLHYRQCAKHTLQPPTLTGGVRCCHVCRQCVLYRRRWWISQWISNLGRKETHMTHHVRWLNTSFRNMPCVETSRPRHDAGADNCDRRQRGRHKHSSPSAEEIG